MSLGQRALEAVAFYRAYGLPVPEWALQEIERCYSDFCDGAPPSGWVREAKAGEAPRTLDAAFGIASGHLKGAKLHARRLRALMGPRVMGYFRPNGGLSRTEENFERVADELGISTAEVQGIVRHFGAQTS